MKICKYCKGLGRVDKRGTEYTECKQCFKDRMSKVMKGKVSPRKGVKLSKETKQKISINRKGKCVGDDNSAKRKTVREKTKQKIAEGNKGKIYTKETKEKCRKIAIKRIERQKLNGMPLTPAMGKYEKPVLDTLEQNFGYRIIRQHKSVGYFLDGYCPALNLAIEIDEPGHFVNGKLRQKDIDRQSYVEEKLGYQFLRIKVPA